MTETVAVNEVHQKRNGDRRNTQVAGQEERGCMRRLIRVRVSIIKPQDILN
jgi:hypothetical protein